jgi:hypothetical protein
MASVAGEVSSLVERMTALNERLHLSDVHIQRLIGEVFARPPLPVARIGFHVAAPDVQIQQSQFACRFTQRVVLLDQDNQQLAMVEVVCVLEFDLDEGPEPDPEALSAYVDQHAYFIAHPYLREAVQTTTTKLGLDPVVLGILRRSEARPSEIIIGRSG